MVYIILLWILFVLSSVYVYVLIQKEKKEKIIILTANRRIFLSTIISVFLLSSILTSVKYSITGKVWNNDFSNGITNNNKLNNNQSDHLSFVKNHFTSTGNDVYGISVISKNGANGYVIFVEGYNKKMAVSYQCTVKTDGTNGIVIIDPGCDYTNQY